MPTEIALEHLIRELHDKQSIREVICNYSRGIDRRDRDLLLSCYHPDALDDHGMFVGGPGDFYDWTDPSHLRYFRTHQHVITNHTCHLEGDVAHTETYWMFAVAGVNYFFRWRQLFLPVLSLHHWSTITQSDAKGARSSVSEICRRFRRRSNA